MFRHLVQIELDGLSEGDRRRTRGHTTVECEMKDACLIDQETALPGAADTKGNRRSLTRSEARTRATSACGGCWKRVGSEIGEIVPAFDEGGRAPARSHAGQYVIK